MTQAQEILSLIEGVDLKDNAKLDEIDARVWCWLNNRAFHGRNGKGWFSYNLHYPLAMAHPRKRLNKDEQYTRSRDALKSIRPEGWWFSMEAAEDGDCVCKMGKNNPRTGNSIACVSTSHIMNYLPTEELAELHAIIKAIDWERNNETP